MTLEYHAFLRGGRLPTRAMWQAALDAMALPLTLPADFIPSEAGGFCAVNAAGRATGCEIDLEDAESLIEDYPALDRHADPADAVLSFQFNEERASAACALGLLASLIQAFGAVVFDVEDDTVITGGEEMEDEARALLAALRPS